MKKILFAAVAVVAGLGASAQQKFSEAMKVNAERHDFGKIAKDVPVTTTFTLTNVSDKPVVIEYAQASCGCTTPEYSREPIAAGGSTKLKVGYNAATMGTFNKPVTIKLVGVNETLQLLISGEVVEAAAAATAKPATKAPVTDTRTVTKVKDNKGKLKVKKEKVS